MGACVWLSLRIPCVDRFSISIDGKEGVLNAFWNIIFIDRFLQNYLKIYYVRKLDIARLDRSVCVHTNDFFLDYSYLICVYAAVGVESR